MATATAPENQIFTFDSSATIGDLLLVVKTLTNTGQKPKLRLVRSYTGEFETVAVDVEPRLRTMEHQGPSAYTVYATNGRDVDGRYLPDLYCGSYETLDEARGCVEFDGLAKWEIWLGDRIVDESPSREMAVTEGEVLVPGPAGLSPEVDAQLRKTLDLARRSTVTLDTPVLYQKRWTTWREIAGRVPCEFNAEGELVAKPFASDPRD